MSNFAVALARAFRSRRAPRRRACSARRADQQDHTEVAREAAAVLHLDEGANAIEARLGLDAADRTVAGDELGRLLRCRPNHGDVGRQRRERIAGEVRGAACDVDPAVGSRGAGGGLAWLRDRLVRHAAAVDDGDLRRPRPLFVAVCEQGSRRACASACDTLQPRNGPKTSPQERKSTVVRTDRRPSRRRSGAHDGQSRERAACGNGSSRR